MLKFIKKLVIKQWLDFLYVDGFITKDEYVGRMFDINKIGSVGRKFQHLVPKLTKADYDQWLTKHNSQ